MKGYKATKKMKCRTLTYEVGKTYEIDALKICEHGFHFCEKMEDVLGYYAYNKDFVLLEVEALGEVETNGNKTVTDKMTVIRVVPKEEYAFIIPEEEYDANGNVIHHKNSNGYEYWADYDSNGNLIHHKNSDGIEYWNGYDSDGNLIHFKDSDEYEYWKEYDSAGNLIHFKDSKGKEWNISITIE